MQSASRGHRAHNDDDRHFANPLVGGENDPPRNSTADTGDRLTRSPERLVHFLGRLPVVILAHVTFKGAMRLAAFISVSMQALRTPMNSPLR
jgi:hypothetical protein